MTAYFIDITFVMNLFYSEVYKERKHTDVCVR